MSVFFQEQDEASDLEVQLEVERLIVQDFAVEQHHANRSNNSARPPDVLTLESAPGLLTHEEDPHCIEHPESEHVIQAVDITAESPPQQEPSSPQVTQQPQRQALPMKTTPGKKQKRRCVRDVIPFVCSL